MLLPFGTSMNIFSNAMAVENDYYGDDETDQYENYAMEMANDNYYKSPGSDFIKKIKCNNINVNVNGFNGATLPTSLSGLATDDEAQAEDEGRIGASSSESDDGRTSSSDSDSRFVCIDNNDNVVVQEEPISELCEECFSANPTLRTEISDALFEFDGSLAFGDGETILVIGPGTDTIEQLCAILESSVEFYGAPISAQLLEDALLFIFSQTNGGDIPAGIDALIECLLEEEIIVDRELPPPPTPDSISDNPITTQSNNPITTQSNNPITTQSNNPITTQSNNPITTTTTTQSSNIGVPQSSNILPNTFSSSPSSTLVNILPSNPN
jgi:hypothetical protein